MFYFINRFSQVNPRPPLDVMKHNSSANLNDINVITSALYNKNVRSCNAEQ